MVLNHILPLEAVLKTPRIVLLGKEHMLIEHHDGIIGYSADKLTIRLGDQNLTVRGEKMMIREFSKLDLSVSGNIDSVEFSK